MKTRSVVVGFVLFFVVGLAAGVAENANMGTWKLNEAKSKMIPGLPKNTTVVYAMEGDKIKVTTDGTGADGQPAHTEWVGKFDGKDYALTGDTAADMRSYKEVNDHTLMLENKKDGKVVASAKIVVAPDGKTRTITITAKDKSGKKISSTGVYDKE
jgi:hypothetical protein